MDDAAFESKGDIRALALARRRGLDASYVRQSADALAQAVLTLDPIRESRFVLCYIDSKDNEAPTGEIIRAIANSGRLVLAPRMGRNHAMAWAALLDPDAARPNRFGIREPRGPGLAIPAHVPCIVPGVAWDRSGGRIGYGGGWYDRFLATHRGVRIGLAFDCQVFEKLPQEPWDQRMDWLVTETQVYDCA